MSAYNINRYYVRKTKRPIYISRKIVSSYDEYGNEIVEYEKPKKYFFNLSSLRDESDIREFGEISDKMRIATVNLFRYRNKFKDFDLAYLEGNTPLNEAVNGEKANYRIYTTREQNAILKIYFLRLI